MQILHFLDETELEFNVSLYINNVFSWPGGKIQMPTLLTLKGFELKDFNKKAWLWLADVFASANHSHAFC